MAAWTEWGRREEMLRRRENSLETVAWVEEGAASVERRRCRPVREG